MYVDKHGLKRIENSSEDFPFELLKKAVLQTCIGYRYAVERRTIPDDVAITVEEIQRVLEPIKIFVAKVLKALPSIEMNDMMSLFFEFGVMLHSIYSQVPEIFQNNDLSWSDKLKISLRLALSDEEAIIIPNLQVGMGSQNVLGALSVINSVSVAIIMCFTREYATQRGYLEKLALGPEDMIKAVIINYENLCPRKYIIDYVRKAFQGENYVPDRDTIILVLKRMVEKGILEASQLDGKTHYRVLPKNRN